MKTLLTSAILLFVVLKRVTAEYRDITLFYDAGCRGEVADSSLVDEIGIDQ